MSLWASWESIGADEVGPDNTVLDYPGGEVWPGTITRTAAIDIATINIIEENFQPVPAADRQYARLSLGVDQDAHTTSWCRTETSVVVLTRDGVARLRDQLTRVLDHFDYMEDPL